MRKKKDSVKEVPFVTAIAVSSCLFPWLLLRIVQTISRLIVFLLHMAVVFESTPGECQKNRFASTAFSRQGLLLTDYHFSINKDEF